MPWTIFLVCVLIQQFFLCDSLFSHRPIMFYLSIYVVSHLLASAIPDTHGYMPLVIGVPISQLIGVKSQPHPKVSCSLVGYLFIPTLSACIHGLPHYMTHYIIIAIWGPVVIS